MRNYLGLRLQHSICWALMSYTLTLEVCVSDFSSLQQAVISSYVCMSLNKLADEAMVPCYVMLMRKYKFPISKCQHKKQAIAHVKKAHVFYSSTVSL
mmetsp:Transcript_20957/g.29365  ORF Transcript_20957/g.29365 Transcript_20957/m.29365 type:complete len:97 (+) Transcript_20957:250-540(+)